MERVTEQDTEQVTEHVTEQVIRLVDTLGEESYSAIELMETLSLKHRPTFHYSYLKPAIEAGLVELTIPDKPRSSKQRYRITKKGTQLRKTDGGLTNTIANQERNINRITYDHRNLAQHIVTDNGMHMYTYNPEGRRIGKQYRPGGYNDWTVNTTYVYGAYGELIAQYEGHTLQYWNISGPDGKTIGRKALTPPQSKEQVLQMKAGTYSGFMRYYYLKDHLGSVRVTLNQYGAVAGYDDFYPFGLQLPGRSNNSANPHDDQKFTGHFLEQEGDLEIYHAGVRMYDPAIGRFLGVDAMRGMYPTINPYHYTLNNPVIYTDPTGMYVVRRTRVTRSGLNTARGLGVWTMAPIVSAASPIYKNIRGDSSDMPTTMDYVSLAVGGSYRAMMEGFSRLAQMPRNYRAYGRLANPDNAFSLIGAFDNFFVENIQEIYRDEVLFDVAGLIEYEGMSLGQTDASGLTFYTSQELIDYYGGNERLIAEALGNRFGALEDAANAFLADRPYFDLTNERHRARLRSYLRRYIREEMNQEDRDE